MVQVISNPVTVYMVLLVGIEFGDLAPNLALKNIAGIQFGGGPNLTCKDCQVLNIGGT